MLDDDMVVDDEVEVTVTTTTTVDVATQPTSKQAYPGTQHPPPGF